MSDSLPVTPELLPQSRSQERIDELIARGATVITTPLSFGLQTPPTPKVSPERMKEMLDDLRARGAKEVKGNLVFE